MAHYQKALARPECRNASAIFPRRITASRAFLANVEAKLSSLASLPTPIVWGDADIAVGNAELWRWEQIFTDHHSVIVEGAGHFVQSDAPVRFASDPRLGRSRLTGAVATDCRSTNRRQWCCATWRPPARRAEPRRP
jgi:haloalkane dehalogenase